MNLNIVDLIKQSKSNCDSYVVLLMDLSEETGVSFKIKRKLKVFRRRFFCSRSGFPLSSPWSYPKIFHCSWSGISSASTSELNLI